MQLNLVEQSCRPYALGLRPPVLVRGTPMVRRFGLRLTLRTSQGASGQGDVAPWPGFAEADGDAAALAVELQHQGEAWQQQVRELGPVHVEVPDSWNGTQAQLQQVLDHLQGLTADAPAALLGGLQTAWLDLLGQLWRQPMARLLAATPVRDVPVHALVDSAWAAGNAYAAGYRALKVKVGRRPVSDELGTLCGIRSAVGPDVSLRLDANGAWPQHVAVQALRMFASVSPAWVEQPIAPGDLSGLRALKALGIVPIAADESITSAASLRALLVEEAVDGVVIKPAFLGGPLTAVQLSAMAQAAGVQVCVTHALESQVGRSAALQVALALGLSTPCGLGGALEGDAAHAPVVHEGRIAAPPGYGLGLPRDEAS